MFSMYGSSSLIALTSFSGAMAPALQGAWWIPAKPVESKTATRTGGPDDDDGDDNDLQWLMPILAVVVMLAVVFG